MRFPEGARVLLSASSLRRNTPAPPSLDRLSCEPASLRVYANAVARERVSAGLGVPLVSLGDLDRSLLLTNSPNCPTLHSILQTAKDYAPGITVSQMLLGIQSLVSVASPATALFVQN